MAHIAPQQMWTNNRTTNLKYKQLVSASFLLSIYTHWPGGFGRLSVDLHSSMVNEETVCLRLHFIRFLPEGATGACQSTAFNDDKWGNLLLEFWIKYRLKNQVRHIIVQIIGNDELFRLDCMIGIICIITLGLVLYSIMFHYHPLNEYRGLQGDIYLQQYK